MMRHSIAQVEVEIEQLQLWGQACDQLESRFHRTMMEFVVWPQVQRVPDMRWGEAPSDLRFRAMVFRDLKE